jgi:hypothetical protein
LQSRCSHSRRSVVVRAEEVSTEVVSTGVVPEEVVSTGGVPEEVVSTRVVPEEVVSTGVVPEEVVSTKVTQAKGLTRETGGQWLSCTTRHVRIYSGVVDPETNLMDQSQLDKLTLMLDPDNEFEWPEEATEKVFDKYRELIDVYAVSILKSHLLYEFRIICSNTLSDFHPLLLIFELLGIQDLHTILPRNALEI